MLTSDQWLEDGAGWLGHVIDGNDWACHLPVSCSQQMLLLSILVISETQIICSHIRVDLQDISPAEVESCSQQLLP